MTTLWRVGRDDLRALLLITLLPLLVAAPLLLGVLNADPALYNASMSIGGHGFWIGHVQTGLLQGIPAIDDNNGVTTQALGYRAAFEMVHGHMPWWNAYTGVGLPLAAEYQPAAFFPPTLLLLLPQGMLLEHLLMQMLAGWGTYALLRQLGLGRLAALTGGTLYAFNGTLALWGSANILPLPFLPWMLFGVERAQAKALLGLRGGWRLFAGAMALSLLAGFPEEAYINGLLVLAWAGLRLFQMPSGKRLAFAWRITLGGLIGVALAAPQIFAFFESLPASFLGLHASHLSSKSWIPSVDLVPSLIAPYAFGTIDAFVGAWREDLQIWGNMGGYVTAAMLIVAACGVIAGRDILRWLLLAWILLALGRMLGIQPATYIWNHIPGAGVSAIYRYIQPSWSFAVVVLVALGFDNLAGSVSRRSPLSGAGMAVLIVFGACLVLAVCHQIFTNGDWKSAFGVPGLRHWMVTSLAWAAVSALVCLALLTGRFSNWSSLTLAVLLMGESAVMFAVPTLSNPSRNETLDRPAIEFLRRNLGLSRFYTLGPIKPNYGAYFGAASINHNYVPNAALWRVWDNEHLAGTADGQYFEGRLLFGGVGFPHQAQELRRKLSAFEWVGVKYVVADSGETPLDEREAGVGDNDRLNLPLTPGQSISGTLPTNLATVSAVAVSLDTRGGGAKGALKVSACSGERCVTGAADLHDGDTVDVPLKTPLTIQDGQLGYSFSFEGDSPSIALWTYPDLANTASQHTASASGPVVGRGLKIRLSGDSAIKPVYSDAVMNIFELPHPASYFEAVSGACTIAAQSRTEAVANCATPAILLRRELFYPGWAAQVNGADAAITKYGDLFQAITLPPGRSVVSYRYAPPHIVWMWMIFWAAFASLAGSGVLQYRDRRRPPWGCSRAA